MGKVFISYRRDDARAVAERIHGRLVQSFGADAVFKDVDSIRSGEDFESRLDAELSQAKVFLVVIGPNWFNIADENGKRRLDDPRDFVRRETEMALRHDCTIIPLTVANAQMPAEKEFPDSIRPLTKRHALEIRYDPDFNHDAQRLVDRLCELGVPLARTQDDAIQEIPPPPRDFVDRDAELRSLLEVVREGRKRILAIRAIGGMGKTAFARRVAEALASDYPLQLHHPMRGSSPDPATPEEAMSEFIRSIDPERNLPTSSTALQKLYLSVLRDKHALILLDDVADRGIVESLIPPADCVLMLTSRRRFLLPGQYSVDLDRLPVSDAVRLLCDICERVGNSGAALADLCGNLPFALRLAAGTLAEGAYGTVEDFIEYLQSDRLRHLEGTQLVLTACLDQLSAESRDLLSMLSVFSMPFTKEGAAAIWDKKHEETIEHLTRLMEFCFVDRVARSERYAMHDLLREHLQRHMGQTLELTVRQRHARFVLGLATDFHHRFATNQIAFSSALAELEPVWPELRSAFGYVNSSASPSLETDQLRSALARESFLFLEARENVVTQLAWAEGGLQAAERAGVDEDIHIHLRRVAWFIRDTQPHKAKELLERALSICRRLQLADDEGKVLGTLGVVAHIQGHLDEAWGLFEESLGLARQSKDKRAEAIALGRKADIHKARKEHRICADLLSEAVGLDQETADERGEGIDLENLTGTFQMFSENEKALECTLRRTEIWRKLRNYGGEWIAINEALSLSRALKKNAEVLVLRRRVAELLSLEELNDVTKTRAMSLGLDAYHDGDGTYAVTFFKKAHEHAVESKNRREEGNALGNLGCAYSLLGEYETAVRFHEQAIAIDRELNDKDGEAMGCWDLGETYERMGEFKKAEDLMRVRIAFARLTSASVADELETRVRSIRDKAGQGLNGR